MPTTIKRDVICIGGSAGSLEALNKIAGDLPIPLEATVFVVLHLHPRGTSYLPKLIGRMTSLATFQARNHHSIECGNIYVAPPDRHLIIADDHMHVVRSPKEGLHRPSINVTFRSAAAAYRGRVVGVLLSGMLDDGASGLWDIAKNGGVTIVQDPDDATYPSMPISALEDVPVNYRLRADEIASTLTSLIAGKEVPAMKNMTPPDENSREQFSGFTCPECRGPLYQHRNSPMEFRCRVGHIFPLKTLLDEETATQERKLYEAIVALEEGADLAEFSATKISNGGGNLLKEAKQLREHAAAIRKLIEERATPSFE